MNLKITKDDSFVYVEDGNTTWQIPINDENEEYLKVKNQTDNFTKNMITPTMEERVEALEMALLEVVLGG